jgi:hypothetical protein
MEQTRFTDLFRLALRPAVKTYLYFLLVGIIGGGLTYAGLSKSIDLDLFARSIVFPHASPLWKDLMVYSVPGFETALGVCLILRREGRAYYFGLSCLLFSIFSLFHVLRYFGWAPVTIKGCACFGEASQNGIFESPLMMLGVTVISGLLSISGCLLHKRISAL